MSCVELQPKVIDICTAVHRHGSMNTPLRSVNVGVGGIYTNFVENSKYTRTKLSQYLLVLLGMVVLENPSTGRVLLEHQTTAAFKLFFFNFFFLGFYEVVFLS